MTDVTPLIEAYHQQLVEEHTTHHGLAVNVKVHTYRIDENSLAAIRDEFGEQVARWLADEPYCDLLSDDDRMLAWEVAAEAWWYDTLPYVVEQVQEDHAVPGAMYFDPKRFHSAGRQGGWCVYPVDNRLYGFSNPLNVLTVADLLQWGYVHDRIAESAQQDGPYDYWWQLGRLLSERAEDVAQDIAQGATYAV